ncbi:MAG: methionine transporter ATP-binding protein [Ramlibacter sp.]|nr:methionine transporter ATP-binding protein [Ramlibacter sp.]
MDEVLDRPLHPYTQGLIGSLPSANRRGDRLRQVPGKAPSLLAMPTGCAFAPRCSRATDVCQARPAFTYPGAGSPQHGVRCFHPALPELAGAAAAQGLVA